MSESQSPASAGSDLRSKRLEAGLTQAELAGKAGCSLTFLANCESGYIPKKSPTYARILEALEGAEQKAAP